MKKTVFLAGLALASLSSCARYEQFEFLTPYEAPTKINEVEVRTHLLDSEERRNLFYTNPSYFVRKYEAVQIHVSNNSNEDYRFSGADISLPIKSYRHVRKKLEKNNWWRNDSELTPHERYIRDEKEKEIEERVRHKTIDRDSVITVRAGLSYTGIILVRKGDFSPNITLKLVDRHNENPLYFDLFVD